MKTCCRCKLQRALRFFRVINAHGRRHPWCGTCESEARMERKRASGR